MMIPLQRSVVVLALTALAALPGAPRTALGAPQQTTATVPTDAQAFAGTWLAESARINTNNSLSRVWRSKVTLTGNTFAISRFEGLPKDLTGTFTLDPSAKPKRIDLKVNEFDMAEAGVDWKYPAASLPGIYRTGRDRLTVCFAFGSDAKRPTEFVAARDAVVLTLARPDEDFTDFPKEVTVRVVDPQGRPAAGATVFSMMSRVVNAKQPQATAQWKYAETAKTGPDGAARVPYAELAGCPAAARDAERGLMGLTAVSPASLQKGQVTVELAPACSIRGTLRCEAKAEAGEPIGWTNVYLEYDGLRLGMCGSFAGDFEFTAPPGTYTLDAYGEELPHKRAALNVPAGRVELDVPPIELEASPLLALKGKPAPELAGVVGWKGAPTRLADLRGRVVLLDFWGYWCGPCVAEMPVLMDLHERFNDRGLTVIGAHLDIDGEVNTAARLDEKLGRIRSELWKARTSRFPVR